jgi:DNA-binding SARP family transcriptional activator
VRYRLLGPLLVARGEAATEVQVDIGPPKQRAVLAVLLLARGRVVSVDRLIDAVWGDAVPGIATASLQAYVSNLRRALRDGAEASQVASPIVRQSPGYYLDTGPADVDLTVFAAAVASAGAAVDAALWEVALAESDTAMALWRGPFLEDLSDQPWVGAEAMLAEEMRRDCLDYRISALLALGRVPLALAAAAQLSAADPLSDRGCWLHVLADVLMGRLITYSGVATASELTLSWSERLNSLRHSRFREDRVISNSVCTMSAMNLGDVDATARRLAVGIEGSEALQLPVLRAQLRWMEAVLAVWHGDFAEAERHHRIAEHVHEQTELYGAGSGLMASVSLLREPGGPIDPQWRMMAATPETGGQDMVDLVKTALLTVSDGPDVAPAAEAILTDWLAARDRPHVWTTLGHLALLAHLAADGELARFAGPLFEELEPFGDRIAVIGQVGVVGPVALATQDFAYSSEITIGRTPTSRGHGRSGPAPRRPRRCCVATCSRPNWPSPRSSVARWLAMSPSKLLASACAGSRLPLESSPERGWAILGSTDTKKRPSGARHPSAGEMPC